MLPGFGGVHGQDRGRAMDSAWLGPGGAGLAGEFTGAAAATPLPDEAVRDIVRRRLQRIAGPTR